MANRAVSSVLTALILLPACTPNLFQPAPEVQSVQEAATSHVAVIAVAPWSSVRKELQPKFDLTAANAYDAVLPLSQQVTSRVLNALDVQLQANLPTGGLSRTQTTTRAASSADGVPQATSETTTSTETKEKKPGAVPAVTADTSKLGSAPELQKGAVSVDPMLRYQAATALMQEVQLLGTSLEYADQTQAGYQAYLVRLQVSLMPRRRDLPFDAYSNIFFYPPTLKFAAKEGAGKAPLYVVPVLITDNLEGSAVARAVEAVRAIGVSVQGTIAGAGVGAGVASRSQDLQSLVANDLNSLMTVGRLTNNAVRVRLGAMYQGTTKYAMVPRTHFITVLVLAREDIRSIQLVSRTELVHAQTGRALGSDPGRTRELLDNRARGLIRGFGYDLNEACLLLKDEQDYKGLEFLRLTQVGRYDVVTECLRKARKTPSGTMLEAVTWSDAEGLRLTRMVTFLLELQTDGVTDKAEFDLPATPPNTPKDRPLSLIQR